MNTIKLTEYEVDIKDSLTWGDKEQIQAEYTKGIKFSSNINKMSKADQDMPIEFDASVTINAKYKLLEVSIVEIRKGDNKIDFTKEWMDNLPIEDGDKLFEAVNSLQNAKKK